jgi:hypothetical protein
MFANPFPLVACVSPFSFVIMTKPRRLSVVFWCYKVLGADVINLWYPRWVPARKDHGPYDIELPND